MTDTTSASLPTRKRPAHMPPIEGHNRPVILFVTLTVRPRGAFLSTAIFHTAFLGACTDAGTWSVGKYLVMPDHIHLFCSPAEWPRVDLRRWCAYLKERVTKRLNAAMEGEPAASRPSWKWQSDCWDTQMRSGEQYHDKWEYVRQNPVRKELVARPEDWPWQGEINVLRW